MKIISWNVNGIRAVQKKGFADILQTMDADIVCLQETKAHIEQLDVSLIHIDNYQSFFCSGERKGYSGVAIYTKVSPLSISHGFGDGRFDNEGRVMIAHYADFDLYNVYFPNGRASQERLDYKMDFYHDFLSHLQREQAAGKNIVVCGDYNTAHQEIDLAHPKENSKTSGFLPIERAWLDELVQAGFIDTFREFEKDPQHYTWWDVRTRARERNVGWRIDYFFINQSLKPRLQNAFILPEIMGSDHCPLGIELQSCAKYERSK